MVVGVSGLSKNERLLLLAMADECSTEYDDFCGPTDAGTCYSFKGLAAMCPALDPSLIRRTVRALARKGFTAYAKGLTNDEGEMRGAGYGITPNGRARAAQADAK